MPFELTLRTFSGPIETLLGLVEERKLPISEISLADVTGDFLKYLALLKGQSNVPHQLLADFIVVASRLILIKSRSLLPDFALTEGEEEEIKDLEERLRLYQAFRPAFKNLARLWNDKSPAWSRPYFLDVSLLAHGGGSAPSVFYPSQNLTATSLEEALRKVYETLQKFELETATIEERIITVEEKIEEILRRLAAHGHATFEALSEEKSKSEIIVIFLALLHLAREELVILEQASHFSDIMVKRL